MKNQRGYIGVDIGTHTIKIAQVEKRAGKVVLMESAIVARRQPWSVNSWQKALPMTSGDELMAALSLGQGFSGRKSAGVTSMALCDVRKMDVQAKTPKACREIIRDKFCEIERFRSDGRQFDYWPIHEQWKSRSNENTYVLSIQNEWANQIAEDHASTRLTCQRLDGIPMALARATELQFPSSGKEPVAILDWGYTRTTFCLELDGCPVFVRMLRDSGFKNTIDSLSSSLDVTTVEAMTLLRDHGVTAEKPGTEIQRTIDTIVAASFNKVLEELERTLQFLRSDRDIPMPRQMVLFGGGATVRNIDRWLTDKIHLEVDSWVLEKTPDSKTRHYCPVELLGPAVALSSLAWSQR